MESLKVTGRSSPDARCAFCHDALEGSLGTCPRCQTAFHRDCGAHLAKCPTLGCGADLRQGRLEEDEPLSPRSAVLAAIAAERVLLLAVLAGAAATLALGTSAGVFERLARESHLALGATLALVLGALLSAAAALLREPSFFFRAPRLVDGVPRPLRATVRREKLQEGELLYLDLASPEGTREASLDLNPVLARAPAWVRELRPGTVVFVWGLGAGPVVIGTRDGGYYAVPACRVKR